MDLGGVERPASRTELWRMTRKMRIQTQECRAGLSNKESTSSNLAPDGEISVKKREEKAKSPGQSFQDLLSTLAILSESL